jgi:hypothetical protein
MPISVSETHAVREEIINAIADLAIAARAGTFISAYQREWAWVDKQNYRDAVDADEFNEAFHGIEREFDRLAQTLAQGSGLSMAPDWEQEITLAQNTPYITVSHDLGTTDLLVDLQAKFIMPEAAAVAAMGMAAFATAAAAPGTSPIEPGTQFWTNIGNGTAYAYGLLDENTILLAHQGGGQVAFPTGDLTLRVRLWKLGE